MNLKKIKILLGKAGLDGHDRGIKIISRALEDAGFDVIYTGVHTTPESIVNSAIKEKVDAIGLSILSGAHAHIFREIFKCLKEKKAENIIVFGGGIVPQSDIDDLKSIGVKEIFLPGTQIADIVNWINNNITPRG
ncbi:MAG: cobalamin B12-binding domain-containing protein [Thermodesulfobacteriota bacterium]